jgi:glucosyl-dolichyl phosphate glucuronosyltransferase
LISISAVVCTFNRCRRLLNAVESLVRQTLDPGQYEILIVDNGSVDGTVAAVETLKKEHAQNNIRYVQEPKLGLANARNRGWREAHGQYIAYLDDDAVADRHYLETALQLLGTVAPTPACVGGPILPLYETPKPQWFKDDYEARSWGDRARPLTQGESFSGSNMVWDRSLLVALGGFDDRFGISGNFLSVGEETLLFKRLWDERANPMVYYSPRLCVRHLVAGYKMTVRYQAKRTFVAGQVISLANDGGVTTVRWQRAMKNAVALGKTAIKAARGWRRCLRWQHWLLEDCRPVWAKAGILLGDLGLILPVRQG